HPFHANTLGNLAGFYASRGQPADAIDNYSSSLTINQRSFDRLFTALTHQQRLQHVAQKELRLYMFLSAALNARAAPAHVYKHLLHWKGIVAARQGEELAALDQPDLQPLIDKVRGRRTSLAKLFQFTPRTAQQQQVWQERIQQTERELEELEVELAQKSE